ncbi:patatin-like phospholipase family protein [Methylobacterium sp. Leaf118]|uniref:patatin-like phospholipase family protein n=1 Tax=Methylobacterium sp. Leaf118 TaxID=2876562 RepID=UPI001E53E52B|nr:patatin-like phospholipase family protein [Methylobacterium sp. Leaf118]
MQTSKRRFLTALAALPVAVLATPGTARTVAPASKPRVAGTAADQESPDVAGIAGARFPADRSDAFRAALGTAPILADLPWLALSTGGDNGAFGAGLLTGWTEAGTRPRFGVVTGVSTGALIAPFAFLGPRWDTPLREAYTTITAADVFEIGSTETSLLDTWPLAKLVARYVTPDLLAAVAAEHATGRRLFVLTTNLDTGRPVAWNLGAIAARADGAALALFRQVLLASGSIPGLFPPVPIAVSANGRVVQELHADGGITAPFYVAPESLLAGEAASLPAREICVIVNNRLAPEFLTTERTLMSVLGNALSAAVKAGTRAALQIHAGFARERGILLREATIDAGFKAPSSAPFDPGTMRALFAHAHRRAQAGATFDAKPMARLAENP